MTYLAISPKEVQELEQGLELVERKVEKLVAERDDYKRALEKTSAERSEYEKAYEHQCDLLLKKAVEFEQLKKREASLVVMLGQACDEMEGIFDTTGQLASPAIATDYTVWARFLEKNYGRKVHRADEIQEWIDLQ